MVDLILASALVAAFYAGFKVGNKFKTLTEALVGLKTWVKSL